MITIPTIQQLYTQIISDLETEFEATINPLGKAFLRCLAAVQAAKLKLYYLVLAAVQKNVAPDTCDEETLYRFGMIKLNRLPFQAVAGQYTIQVTGSIGAVIKASSTFKSDDTALNPGILYVLDQAYTLTATTDNITVRALTAGSAGKLDISDTLTATAPIALVDSAATVTAEAIQPLDAETIEDYRAKVVAAYRLEPLGGAATDYRIWASDAQGVEQVYPYARSGYPSEIDLYIEATVSDSTDGKGTPSAQTIEDVEDVVNFDPDTSLPQNERGRRPLQVIVNYHPVTPLNIAITISSYQNLDATKQATILTELTGTVNAIRPYVAAADPVTSKNDILDNNKIIGAIITAVPGSVFGAVTFTVSGSPFSTYTFAGGEIPYLVTVSYT